MGKVVKSNKKMKKRRGQRGKIEELQGLVTACLEKKETDSTVDCSVMMANLDDKMDKAKDL